MASTSGGYRIDRQHFPFTCITVENALTDEQCVALAAELRTFASNDHPYAVVVDMRRASLLTAHQRALLADAATKAHSPLCVGVALLTTSRLLQGAATAAVWLLPAPPPLKAYASPADALGWLLPRLKAVGVRVPATTQQSVQSALESRDNDST